MEKPTSWARLPLLNHKTKLFCSECRATQAVIDFLPLALEAKLACHHTRPQALESRKGSLGDE